MTVLTLCGFTLVLFITELTVLLHQRGELQKLSVSFKQAEENQLKQLNDAVARVDTIKKGR